ncbi:unnamed protein product [Paramecium primaurelia]|uniref:UBC core domain-containing protein n=1 Tax=Paramecium primaurelia TaxID=5886 RepID=A0A8S1QIP8_PARPR|nr:unnamed protein product [Paramecium primaurelia]
MATAFQMKRLQYEEQNLEENSDQLPPNCSYKKTSNLTYVVQYIGEKGTPHEGAYIVVDVDLSGSNGSSGFPAEAPNITFRNGFQHVNVYPMGKLCMYLSNKETFTAGTTLLEIFSGINQVIHHPTFHDPANASILIQEGGKGYDEKMRDQAKKLSQPQYRVL